MRAAWRGRRRIEDESLPPARAVGCGRKSSRGRVREATRRFGIPPARGSCGTIATRRAAMNPLKTRWESPSSRRPSCADAGLAPAEFSVKGGDFGSVAAMARDGAYLVASGPAGWARASRSVALRGPRRRGDRRGLPRARSAGRPSSAASRARSSWPATRASRSRPAAASGESRAEHAAVAVFDPTHAPRGCSSSSRSLRSMRMRGSRRPPRCSVARCSNRSSRRSEDGLREAGVGARVGCRGGFSRGPRRY